ncbi:MAG: phage major capsid protein, partial [Propionibacteriaceae bacterium]|nr:phage major capsid protein [Propionibacteriaceae bacterium]
QTGGREAVIPVSYNRSSNTKSFKRADTVPLNIDEVATMAHAPFSYYTDAAALTWQEFIENRGESARFSIIKARMEQAVQTIKERVDIDLHSTGDAVSVGNSGKNIIGMKSLIPLDPTTGTVWGISRDTYSWWQSQLITAGGTLASTGIAKLALAWTTCSGTNGEDPPSLFVTTPTMWQGYHSLVSGKQQITTTKVGDLGFRTLEFMGKPIFYDALQTANTWWVLNMNYARMILQNSAVFDVQETTLPSHQVLKGAWRILFGGQFGFERYDRQGHLVFTG